MDGKFIWLQELRCSVELELAWRECVDSGDVLWSARSGRSSYSRHGSSVYTFVMR